MSAVKLASGNKRAFTPRARMSPEDIPDTWASVHEFCTWWYKNGTPMMVPDDAEVYCSDDATSIVLFRKGQFQVELYLVFPLPNLPMHEHPRVEVIKSRPPLYDQNNEVSQLTPVSETLLRGQRHGAGKNFDESDEGSTGLGFPLLAFQKWDDDLKPTTVASRWRGQAVGPKQAELVRRYKPDAYWDGFIVDVTREQEDVPVSSK